MSVTILDTATNNQKPDVILAQAISIRDAGFDEYWLQDQIVDNPACLGLGDLEPIAKKRRQSSGGSLDIFLKNLEDDTMNAPALRAISLNVQPDYLKPG